MSVDLGLSHVALPVADLDASIAFYETYAGMTVVHRRTDVEYGHPGRVAWLCDGTRPFIIVLIERSDARASLRPIAHLGVGVASPADVDQAAARALEAGLVLSGPHDYGPPVGYFVIINDPDGNGLELAYGQEVALIVEEELHHS